MDDFLSENRRAFPDFKFEPSRVSATTDNVLVEGRFKGPTWAPGGLLSTGRKVDFPMCLIFEFEGDMMVNERLYFNIGTPLAQLGWHTTPTAGEASCQQSLPIR